VLEIKIKGKVMANKNFVEQVVSFILGCSLEELKELTITDITRYFDVSKMHLIEKFKSQMEITPGKFILREKMYRAASMMEHNHALTVREVTGKIGFSTDDYFIRVFKKYFGTSPCQYRDIKLKVNKKALKSKWNDAKR